MVADSQGRGCDDPGGQKEDGEFEAREIPGEKEAYEGCHPQPSAGSQVYRTLASRKAEMGRAQSETRPALETMARFPRACAISLTDGGQK